MKTVRFGIIGCGLMGREFASAAARWCHLPDAPARPEIVALCNRSPGAFAWYQDNLPTVAQVTQDYRALLANPKVEAVYVALPDAGGSVAEPSPLHRRPGVPEGRQRGSRLAVCAR